MEITKAWVVCIGACFKKRVHLLSSDAQWRIAPSLADNAWDYVGGTVHAAYRAAPSSWRELIPIRRGCLATRIMFDNGKVVYI
jgi:hypothetical protein